MPNCPRCGKQLCNQQSLENHLRSNVCRKKMENLTTTRNHHAYDIWLTCDFRGNITHIDKDSASILEYTAEEVLGNKVYQRQILRSSDSFEHNDYKIA